ncbi:YrdC-like domain [Macleaya cordata]|uniref:Threonylcarbamoyl-AMP synthase n=1 Tax=Macleaya cordata TaxID=56857 RepID=A0A200R450_MACCD|nr:YrdC-like domain [Macleaya cordata]
MALKMIAVDGANVQSLSFSRCFINLRLVPSRSLSFNFKTIKPPHRLGFCTSTAKRNPKRLKYSAPRFTKGDGLLYVEVDPSGADSWKLEPVVKLLKEGAVGVIPTDTVYVVVQTVTLSICISLCFSNKFVSFMQPLSILCHSFRDIDTYTLGFPRGNGQGSTNIFRVVKHCLPGPYTFILPASKELPKQCTRYGSTAKYATRKNVGVRMPDDTICQAILEKMGAPLISTSVKCLKEEEWIIDPVAIADIYESKGLDFIVAGGTRVADPSTIVDMTGDSPTIIRQGKGPKLDWMVVKEDQDSAMSVSAQAAA